MRPTSYFQRSQSVVSVSLESGEVIDFRKVHLMFPAVLNHEAVQTVRHAPAALWNNEQVVAAVEKVLGSTTGKIVAIALGLAVAEFWAKTVACDWISGDNGAVVWLEPSPPHQD